jgi:type I restriction enzyme, S subunit
MSNSFGLMASIYYGKSPSEVINTDGLYPIIGTGGEFGRASKSLFLSGIVVPRKGSLGNPQLLESPFWPTDTTYVVIPNSQIDACWLYYNLLNFDLTKLNEATGVPSINRDRLAKLTFFDPGYQSQKKIAEILSTIDRTITHTEALIEKYQQIKAGLMHDLFTRGIGADGKLRPPRDQAPEMYRESSIGWIPKEWNLRKLVELADICSGVTLGSKRTSEQTISVPYLRVANVQDGYLDLSDVKEITVSRKTFDSLILQVGDVLMNEGGDFDKLGRGTIWRGEISPCIHQNHVFRVRTNSQTLNHLFLAYWSQSFYGKKYFILNSKVEVQGMRDGGT